jgi:hypothetical protein
MVIQQQVVQLNLLVLDRAKWTDPEIVSSAELFPPAN